MNKDLWEGLMGRFIEKKKRPFLTGMGELDVFEQQSYITDSGLHFKLLCIFHRTFDVLHINFC